MLFRILGSPELYDDIRHRRVPLNAPKQRLLLGALLFRPNSPLPRELLIRELWGAAPPPKAAKTLNAHVSLLRRALAELEPERAHAPRLVTRESGYALQADAADTDSGRFRLALDLARTTAAADPDGTYESLRDALGMWRGSVLEGGALGPVSARLAARLDEQRQEGFEILFDCALRTGQHRCIIPELEEVTAAYPLRERFHDQLMLALSRCGRGPEAIDVYQRARRHLSPGRGGSGHTPLLTARLEEIGRCSPAPAGSYSPAPQPPSPRSVAGYLTVLLSGQALYTG